MSELKAVLLAAALVASSSALAFTLQEAADACKAKGVQMQRFGERADAWQWFCMEENHLVFSGCTYSPNAIYRPECWVRRPVLAWPASTSE